MKADVKWGVSLTPGIGLVGSIAGRSCLAGSTVILMALWTDASTTLYSKVRLDNLEAP